MLAKASACLVRSCLGRHEPMFGGSGSQARFSPTPETFPASLQPIQELNLTATRAHSPVAKKTRQNLPKLLTKLVGLGLRPSTIARTVAFLAKTKLRPERAWEKVSLQPILNLDIFEKLYRKHRPDIATFHTNHVAHYQHRYWRSMDSKPFLSPPSEDERRRFGGAIEYGYRVADEVLQRIWNLADENTVVILASGLGQKPYVVEDFKEGRTIVRVRDVDQIVELCGVTGHCTPVMMMAPQWNLEIKDDAKRAQAERVLKTAWYRTPETRLFAYEVVGDTINFNLFQKNMKPLDLDATCGFPEAGGKTMKLRDIAATADATPKEGVHDPDGVLIMRGAGVRHGAQLGKCSNLDIAPTILHLMGLPIPSHMRGRVLEEALEARSVAPSSSRGINPSRRQLAKGSSPVAWFRAVSKLRLPSHVRTTELDAHDERSQTVFHNSRRRTLRATRGFAAGTCSASAMIGRETRSRRLT